MDSGRDIEWRDHLIEARAEAFAGGGAQLYSAVDSARLRRVAPGVYLPSEIWRALDLDDRFRARIAAAALRFPDDRPFSHLSAAALWGLPAILPWPGRAEVLMERTSGGRSRRGIVRHAHGIPDRLESIDGESVTSLARTVIDAASVLPFAAGVAMADFALRGRRRDEKGTVAHRVTPHELADELAVVGPPRGRARRARAVEFADGRSGSPGESLSRCVVAAAGFPAPELQTEFRDDAGLIGYVDFWWPDFGLIGEFDGQGKYLRDELRQGRTAAEVVIDEKIREDRLRALGPRVARWGWDTARSPQLLATLLRRAGLPQRRRFSSTPR